VRVLVTHHPLFALTVGDDVQSAIGRQDMALDAVEEAGVDVLLAGHNHHASVNSARDLVTRAGGALVVQAGTATSTRVRDQDQSFNLVDITEEQVVLTVYSWGGEGYRPADAQAFEQRDGLWALVHTPQPAG
jgi:predicted phosphodiesterase